MSWETCDDKVKTLEVLSMASTNSQPKTLFADAGYDLEWVHHTESDIQAFAAELFKVEPSSVPVAHLKKDAV